ncbi:TonB-dependent receptor [Bacteroides sp. 214]|uniref:SusC/RagA family TonB-linked outer membrane protein n=1 Tax=Bacteroides sp. 214 TaxID=2302935 RepID=UPI0013D7E1E9|nr:TonB-dependent receptor [Bacteroides sp. 214]NDW13647.1 TonB-dependent receptor [Bacteroides sp. 214]
MKTKKQDKMSKSRSILLLLSFLMLGSWNVYAQQISVKGVVKDTFGDPVIGASVVQKDNPGNGTITNVDGEFTVNVPQNSKLKISYLGMKDQEVTAVAGKILNITLQDDARAIDEVVVIGYSSRRRGDLTGSVASIGANTLKDIPVTSAAAAISGRLAGVSVVTTQGSPDASINIRVRGGGSITQDNDPLYIVDGFEVSSINDVPPGDIESIDVLKDASSTAIYGAKGANGVILITTKTGKAGKIKISFDTSFGFSKMYNHYPVMSPYEYVYMQKELDPTENAGFFDRYGRWEDVDIYKSVKGTDWQDELFGRTGVKQNYTLSIMGGDEKMTYNLSYIRDNEDYIMIGSNYTRDNINAKFTRHLNKALKLDFQSKLTRTVIDGASISSGRKLRDAIRFPNVDTLDSQTEGDMGDEYDPSALYNLNDPYYNIVNEHKKQMQFTNSYNVGLTWQPIKGLVLRGEGTYNYIFNKTDNIFLNKTGEASGKGGMPVSKRMYQDGFRYTYRATANYNKTFSEKHSIIALVGFEFNSLERNKMDISSDYYPVDYSIDNVLSMWNDGSPQPTYTTVDEPSRTQSYFTRLTYNFSDRYIIDATARYDGTNVFAPGNKWGFFPAASAAWRISEEAFMEPFRGWLDNLKLRGGYGLAGNSRVGSYWRQTYSPVTSSKSLYYMGESPQSSLQPSTTLRNEKLTWETKYSTNIGLDISLFGSRLNISPEIYHDVTKDLILQIQLPSTSGYANQYQNVGQTTNKGFELTIDATPLQGKDYYLGVNFNIAFNKNNVDFLYGDEEKTPLISSSNSITGNDFGRDNYRTFVGDEIGLIYGYKTDGYYSFDDFTFNHGTKKWELKEGVTDCRGVYTSSGDYFGPGHIKLKDLGGANGTPDGKIDADNDRTIIGRTQPKFTGGFSLNGQWKGFDVAAMFNFSYGNDVLNANKIDYSSFTGSKRYQNMTTIMNLDNRFTTIDPVTGFNIYHGKYANPERLEELNQNAKIWHPIANGAATTDWAVEDGSFLRFSNLTIGYTLPKQLTQRAGIQNLRVYGTVNNLYVWTNYSGQDPEVDTSGSVLRPGTDLSAYPKARTFIFGLNLTF